MDFCDKCGTVMVAKKEKDKTILICRKCGHKVKNYKPLEIEESLKKAPLDDVVIVEKKQETLPKTKVDCPKCNNKEALWWIQQTRSIDEAPTLFLRCTKCSHSWREYG
ncbi:MAG: transcription factor S [Candidatus Aenigmarchaeota archaeon]|nr:transcription factor S [Candidatus Aenigmarchaeota archaeon]